MHKERFLQSLERELSRYLPAHELALRLAETNAHLDDGIAARLELGLTLEEAEQEAVVAYGKPRSVAQAVLRPLYVSTVCSRVRWLIVAYAILAGCYARLDLLTEAVPFLAPAMLSALALCSIGAASASFRSRKSASLPILIAGFGAGLFFCAFFGVAWLNLWQYGGTGYTSRWVERGVLEQAQWEPLRSALADPVGNLLSQSGPGFAMGLGLAAIFAVIDWTAAQLGAVCADRPRRRGVV